MISLPYQTQAPKSFSLPSLQIRIPHDGTFEFGRLKVAGFRRGDIVRIEHSQIASINGHPARPYSWKLNHTLSVEELI